MNSEGVKQIAAWFSVLIGLLKKSKWEISDKHFSFFANSNQKFSVKIRFIMYTKILKNLGKFTSSH